LLPGGVKPCVWMSAGLLAYKLCDRDFDCETCPLDAALRGDAPEPAATESEISPRTVAMEFRDDRRYHGSHTWAQARGDMCVRLGVDMLAASLLPAATSVILPTRDSTLWRGRAGCWLNDNTGPIPLKMPVSGLVARTNPQLRTYPALVSEAPYDGGWLVEVRCSDVTAQLTSLMPAESMQLRSHSDLRRFHRRLAFLLRRGGSPANITLADGGKPLADLRQVLGASRYLRLFLEFLR